MKGVAFNLCEVNYDQPIQPVRNQRLRRSRNLIATDLQRTENTASMDLKNSSSLPG
jgi:hypothetical protein